MDINNDNETSPTLTPPNFAENVNIATTDLISKKSKKKCEKTYEEFML